MKPLAVSLALLALGLALQAQSAPPSPAPTPRATAAPYRVRPTIIVNPKDYLPSPTPSPRRRVKPRPHATPVHRRPLSDPTPEVFERYDTAPSPSPR